MRDQGYGFGESDFQGEILKASSFSEFVWIDTRRVPNQTINRLFHCGHENRWQAWLKLFLFIKSHFWDLNHLLLKISWAIRASNSKPNLQQSNILLVVHIKTLPLRYHHLFLWFATFQAEYSFQLSTSRSLPLPWSYTKHSFWLSLQVHKYKPCWNWSPNVFCRY